MLLLKTSIGKTVQMLTRTRHCAKFSGVGPPTSQCCLRYGPWLTILPLEVPWVFQVLLKCKGPGEWYLEEETGLEPGWRDGTEKGSRNGKNLQRTSKRQERSHKTLKSQLSRLAGPPQTRGSVGLSSTTGGGTPVQGREEVYTGISNLMPPLSCVL